MSDLTIFSRYNKHPKNQLAKEFCTFDHHRLHVFQGIFSMHLCVLGSMQPVLKIHEYPTENQKVKKPEKTGFEKTQKNP